MDLTNAIQSLPEDRKLALKHWLVRQKLIADALGVDMAEWSRHLDWATRNCFDGAYLQILEEHAAGDMLTSKTNREAEKATGIGATGTVFGAVASDNSNF